LLLYPEVTLYFTQGEFDQYNALNSYNLPAGPQDDNNIRNLVVTRYEGTSNDLSGKPQSYTGKKEEIYVQPQDVIWNSQNQRWEVRFFTKGWGGFFLQAHDGTLAHNWIQVKADWLGKQPRISWEVSEKAQRSYLPEYSLNGTNFYSSSQYTSSLGTGHHIYSGFDTARAHLFATGNRPALFYRIRATDQNGTLRYSPVVSLAADGNTIYLYPNPIRDELTLTLVGPAPIRISDLSGRVIWEGTLPMGQTRLSTTGWQPGMYFLKNLQDGSSYKIIRL
jgi:hypothetical protein